MGSSPTWPLQCPMCCFSDYDNYALTLHVETAHFADDSPFVASEDTVVSEDTTVDSTNTETTVDSTNTEEEEEDPDTDSNDNYWVTCFDPDCQQEVALVNYPDHLDFHMASNIDLDSDAKFAERIQAAEDHLAKLESMERAGLARKSAKFDQKSSQDSSKSTKKDKNHPRRLGKKELGPYAYEKRMPAWMHDQIRKGGKRTTIQKLALDGTLYRVTTVENQMPGIIPVLATLIQGDTNVKKAYLCWPGVDHVFKLPKEAAFCGYRNIQMLASFMKDAKWTNWEKLCSTYYQGKENKREEGIPNVLDLQDMIEKAWEKGIHAHGKIETGGVWDTRKYIGTPELEAILELHKIPYRLRGFTDCRDPSGISKNPAYEQLLTTVEDYFASQRVVKTGPIIDRAQNPDARDIHLTNAPPMYFQHPGHSLTIIGIEEYRDGKRGLVVLDPAYEPGREIHRMLERDWGSIFNETKPRANPSNSQSGQGSSNPQPTPSSSNQFPSTSPRAKLKAKGVEVRPNTKEEIASKARHSSRILEMYRRQQSRLKKFSEFEIFILQKA